MNNEDGWSKGRQKEKSGALLRGKRNRRCKRVQVEERLAISRETPKFIQPASKY